MAHEKDLRDLAEAIKKVSRSLADTIDERTHKSHPSHFGGAVRPTKSLEANKGGLASC
jgi:hypothetical protein